MAKELNYISNKAQEGDIHSMFRLALLYIQGNNIIIRDPSEALYWLKKVIKKCPSYYSGCIMNLVYGLESKKN